MSPFKFILDFLSSVRVGIMFMVLLFVYSDFLGDTLLHPGYLDFVSDAPFWLKPAGAKQGAGIARPRRG